MISRAPALLIAIALIAIPRAATCGTGAPSKRDASFVAVESHANFFGPLAVDSDISSNLFGQVVNAAPAIAAMLFFSCSRLLSFMLEFFNEVEQTGFSIWVQKSPSLFAYPMILFLHTVGLAFLVGPTVALGARVLGFARRLPLMPMEGFYRSMWIGFRLRRSYDALGRQRLLKNIFEEDHNSPAWVTGATSHLHSDGCVYGVGLPR
jgi:hypothetical protein